MNTEYECHACQGSTASGAKSQVQKPHLKSVGRARTVVQTLDSQTDGARAREAQLDSNENEEEEEE